MFSSFEEETSDQDVLTDRASPIEQAEPDRVSNNVQVRAISSSPSILHQLLPHNSNSQNPEPLDRTNVASSSQSSDTYTENDTYVTPVPRHIANQLDRHLRHEELNRIPDMRNMLSFVNQVETLAEGVASEDSSVTASSASEDSNQSVPEAHVRVNTDAVQEPPAKVRKISSPVKDLNKSDDLDGETCPICLDTWGNSGKHRLVALKCGHLFGAECVERWLKAQAVGNRSCPTCKSKAALKDLRCIYARKLVAADNSEITRLQRQVEILQAEKSRTELNLQTATMTQRALAEQLEKLKKTMSKSQATKQEADRKSWRFALEKNLEICKDGGCRVLTYNCRTYELYVSQKSSNNLFPGYGIRKVSCVDYSLGQFVYLHPKPIRDISYSQTSDLLLSVGLDSTARIVERGIPSVTVNAGYPLWSCAWNYHSANEFYVGGVGGVIRQYDSRNPSTIVRTLSGTGDMSPVVSLCSTEFGLLSCQLNSCWIWESKMDQLVPRAFPVTGAFMSMCYDPESQRALISMRPKGAERSKLAVYSLQPTLRGTANIEADTAINGSARTSVMSRATFCKTLSASWVAAHSESDSTLYLHGMNGSRTMSLPAAEPALDVCSVQVNGNSLLAALSETRLRIYKAVQTSV